MSTDEFISVCRDIYPDVYASVSYCRYYEDDGWWGNVFVYLYNNRAISETGYHKELFGKIIEELKNEVKSINA